MKIGKVPSNIIQPANSLIAGCISAIWLSRIMVSSILAETHKIGPIRTRNYFDDMVSRITSKDGKAMVRVVVNHGANLAGKIAAARLKFKSEKTVVVASSLALAKTVA